MKICRCYRNKLQKLVNEAIKNCYRNVYNASEEKETTIQVCGVLLEGSMGMVSENTK